MARQLALVTRRQMLEADVSQRQIDGLVRRGAVRRMRAGVYALSGAPATWEQALLAAVLAGGPGAAASHSAAAYLWRFAVQLQRYLEIVVPRPRHPFVRGVVVHSSSVLTSADVTRRSDVPTTTFERTLIDVTTQLSLMQLGRVLDDGLRRNVTSLERFDGCVRRLDSGPRRRLSLAQHLLIHRDAAFERAGSRRELRVWKVLQEANLPLPTQQHRVRVGERTYILDYAYPDLRRFIEYYELGSHATPGAVAYDSDRISRLCNLGWQPLIFTDATSDDEIVAQTRMALGADLERVGRRSA
jgi:hypothetical protein